MELRLHSCLVPLDHPDFLSYVANISDLIFSPRAVILYMRAKFCSLLSNATIMTTRYLFITLPW